MLAEHLGQGQHQVGGRGAGGQRAQQLDAHHDWRRQVHGLAEHGRLGLDAAHAPAQHTDPVDHGGVGVGAHQGVRDGHPPAVDLADLDHPRQVLEVDLVADAHPGRHHREVVERLLRPAQQRVALAVALVLALDVVLVGAHVAEDVDLDGVVDDQVDRDLGVDALGVAARLLDRGAHGGQVDDRGHAGEVLQQDPGRSEGQLGALRRLLGPPRQGAHAGFLDAARLQVAQQHLEEDLNGHGQGRRVAQAELANPF